MHALSRRSFLVAGGVAIASSNVSGADWDQWRGPTRDGAVDAEYAWPSSLDASSLTAIWEQPLEPSYSGPIVIDDMVFVTETVKQKSERITAFHKNTGERIWTQDWSGAMTVPFFAAANGSWIRSTPAATSQHLLVGGMRDVLVCLDPKTGQEIWRQDFVKSLGSQLPSFGFVSSPLIDGSHAYVQAGGGFVKLDIATGEVVWRVLDDGGGMNGSAFSSPIIATIAGQRQLLVQTREKIVGVAIDDGRTLWSTTVPAYRGMNILTPTVYQDLVFTSTYRNGSYAYRVTKRGDRSQVDELWSNRVQGYMSSPIVFDGHVYLHLANGRLTCMHAETGKQAWSSRPFGKYWSCVAQGDRMLALDERGDLLLIRLNPEKFELLGQQTVAENSWAHLGIANDLLFVRDLERLTVHRWS